MAYIIFPAKLLSLVCHSVPVPLPQLISTQQPCTGSHKWASDQWAHDHGWPSPVFFNMSRSFLPPYLCPGCSLNSESPSPSPHENPTQASKVQMCHQHLLWMGLDHPRMVLQLTGRTSWRLFPVRVELVGRRAGHSRVRSKD